ncbi:MAG TPA: universal stress protein [Candidatus Binatia bacterium]|nr:universal stress protein [Candidatus Binatia bacterium]
MVEKFTPRRILVPVNGATSDEDALRFAFRLALRQRGKVFAVAVVEVPRGLPLSNVQGEVVTAAEKVLQRAEEVGREYEVETRVEVLQAREAAPAIVEEATALSADLVVVGLSFRERFGEFYLGRTVPYILRHAPCRVMLLREEPPG